MARRTPHSVALCALCGDLKARHRLSGAYGLPRPPRIRHDAVMLRLRCSTSEAWIEAVIADLDTFLQDHAANERKVSASAMTLAVHYPHRRPLVDAMVRLAREELEHFARVYDLLIARGRSRAASGRAVPGRAG